MAAKRGLEEDDSLSAADISVKKGKHVLSEGILSVDEEDHTSQTIMSAFWQAGRLGLSFYEVEAASLRFMPDSAELEDFQLMSRVLWQVAPHTVILSSKQDERLREAVKAYTRREDSLSSSVDGPPPQDAGLETLPSSDFGYDSCKRRVLALTNLPGMSPTMSEDERHIYLSSLLPLGSTCMVRSLGALLKFLDKKRVGIELEAAGVRVPVLSVSAFTLDNMMTIDENSYCALQIFQKESHPSSYKLGSGAKEGLSLFGIANRTRSKLGSRLLRLWFLRPLKDLATLTERQEAIAFFSKQCNQEVMGNLADCLRNIKNLPRVLVRMSTAQVSISDWQALYKTTYNAVYIGEVCRTLPQEIAIFKKISSSFTEELHQIAGLINRIIDFDESASQNRFTVKPGVDPELDEKKRTYNGLPDFMTQVARQELENLSEDIPECNVIYLPQLGYLLAIPRGEHVTNQDDFEIEGLEFVFYSNNMVYYKSPRTRELDTLLGDTQCDIIDHETAIMHRLQEVVLEHSGVLLLVMEHSAELDCLIALSAFAIEHNLVCPQLTEDNVIHIQAGRHPLQELCVTTFVPNDTVLDLDQGRVKILTGPNASGKSVYMKQVGLIVFLAHIGSFVPAESAKIGVLDSIFTRIHTRETVSIPLSTFMIDLNQVSSAVRLCVSRSLIILDEFGKGTATNDGLSLLTATLRHWIAKQEDCPNVLVSTHFHSLMHKRLLQHSPLVDYLMMEVLQENHELVFLYSLVKGQGDSSQACHIAATAGLPREVVDRGAEVSEIIRRNQPLQRRDAVSMEHQLSRCSAIVERFMQLDLEKDDAVSFLKDFVIPASEGLA